MRSPIRLPIALVAGHRQRVGSCVAEERKTACSGLRKKQSSGIEFLLQVFDEHHVPQGMVRLQQLDSSHSCCWMSSPDGRTTEEWQPHPSAVEIWGS